MLRKKPHRQFQVKPEAQCIVAISYIIIITFFSELTNAVHIEFR